MDAQTAVDLCRDSIWVALLIAAPVLLAGTVIGLLIGLFQALTQIQEQTIAIVLKILVMILVIAFLMPWMADKMIDYSAALFQTVPEVLIKESGY
jgi:flagellar biosynthetic protein FliQ